MSVRWITIQTKRKRISLNTGWEAILQLTSAVLSHSLMFCINGPFQHWFVFSSFLSSYCSASLNLLWNYFNNFDQRNNFKWIAFWGVSECVFNNMRCTNRKCLKFRKYCWDTVMSCRWMNALLADCCIIWIRCKLTVDCVLKGDRHVKIEWSVFEVYLDVLLADCIFW